MTRTDTLPEPPPVEIKLSDALAAWAILSRLARGEFVHPSNIAAARDALDRALTAHPTTAPA